MQIPKQRPPSMIEKGIRVEMDDARSPSRTDKAAFLLIDATTLLKRYFTENAVERAEQDSRSLSYLNRHFSDVMHGGWRYSVVKYHSRTVDGKGIIMDYVPGLTLSAVPKKEAGRAEWQCGVWMAVYHERLTRDGYEGLIYTDPNVHNLIVDTQQRRVTAVDPGMKWGREGFVYEDVIKHVNSTLFVLVARGRFPPSAIGEFLKGYRITSVLMFNPRFYFRSLLAELRREMVDLFHRSVAKSILFSIAVILLAPLYVVIVPLYLRGVANGRNKRGADT